MNHLPYPTRKKSFRERSAEMGTGISRVRTPSNSKLFQACTAWPFSPATGGSQMVGRVRILKLITRPSNEMLNHWVYSAACSRSSPTAQPAATTIVDSVYYPFPSYSIHPFAHMAKPWDTRIRSIRSWIVSFILLDSFPSIDIERSFYLGKRSLNHAQSSTGSC